MQPRPALHTKMYSGFWIISVFASLIVRIPGLKDEANWWRAIQTQLSAYWFQRNGIDLVHYQTPLYGPPWRIPLEFPLFQATGALIARLGDMEIGTACRLAALLSFYLCALVLFLVAKNIFSSTGAASVMVTIFLWTPYNIYHSTEPLIDYTALMLTFAYFYAIYRWLFARPNWLTAAMAVLCGSLTMLVKPTSMPVIVGPILTLVWLDVQKRGYFAKPLRLRTITNRILQQRGYWITLALMALVPLLVGSAWTRYADAVKNASIYTQWLTSAELREWNFGTWELRSNPAISIGYFAILLMQLAPYALGVFALLGLVGLRREGHVARLFLIGIIASAILEMAVFLNLFQHNYYYIVFSASMAILVGYGIWNFWQAARREAPLLRYIILAALLVSAFFGVRDFQGIRSRAVVDSQQILKQYEWATQVQQYVSEDHWVVVVEDDWRPDIPYALERRTMVVTPRERGKPVCDLLSDPHFSLVVSLEESADTQPTLECFSSHTEVLPGVYQVYHQQ